MAEEQDHHPDIFLAWGRVKVTIWTHKIDGLAESDFVFAAKTEVLTPLYVKTAAQEALLSCWRVRKSVMTR